MRCKETTPIFLSRRWGHCVWFFYLVVCNVLDPGETVWFWHWFGTFVNCWTSQEDNKEYAVHALPVLHPVCLPLDDPKHYFKCNIPLSFNAVFFWCALMYSCPKATEEQCVSRLQCSWGCMRSGHQSTGTVLGWANYAPVSCDPNSPRLTWKNHPTFNL